MLRSKILLDNDIMWSYSTKGDVFGSYDDLYSVFRSRSVEGILCV